MPRRDGRGRRRDRPRGRPGPRAHGPPLRRARAAARAPAPLRWHDRGGPMTRLGHLATETARAERAEIDRLPTAELVRLMHEDDLAVAAAVREALPQIAAAVDAIAERFAAGGRLIYAGAGTAGPARGPRPGGGGAAGHNPTRRAGDPRRAG